MINEKHEMNSQQININEQLIKASEEGNLEQVKKCLENGANIHVKNDISLQWASYYGHLEVVKYLISQGANIHVLDDRPLRWASENGHLEVVKYLISQGADSSEVEKRCCDKDVWEYLQSLKKDDEMLNKGETKMKQIGEIVKAEDLKRGYILYSDDTFYYIDKIDDVNNIVEYSYIYGDINTNGRLDIGVWGEQEDDILVDIDPFLEDENLNNAIELRYVKGDNVEIDIDEKIKQYIDNGNSRVELISAVMHYVSPYEILKSMKPIDIDKYVFENNLFHLKDEE